MASDNAGMDIDPAIPLPPDDDFEPSQSPRSGRLRRFCFGAAAVAVALLAVPVAMLSARPAFHRVRLPVGGPLDGGDPAAAAARAEQDARRLVTDVAALHAAFERVGRWEGVVTERQLNAWLALDWPRHHADLADGWGRDARIELGPGKVRAGCRIGRGLLSAISWLEAEVRLREVNQLGITIADARLGSLPIPRGPVLKSLARRLETLGLVTEIRRFEDQSVLVVYIPSTHEAGGLGHWLEAVRIAPGELAVAGETRRGSVPPAGRER
jgi:hypothetical protein